MLARMAVAVAEVLAEKGAKISAESVTRGMAEVQWPGRMQVLRKKPWVTVDGAHNAASIRAAR